MNTLRKFALVNAVIASFALAVPAQAADTVAQNTASVDVCATTANGSVPKEKLVKALHRMLDMGDTQKAATLPKEEKRKLQFDAFWKELGRESSGG